jgi:hypothetical protein
VSWPGSRLARLRADAPTRSGPAGRCVLHAHSRSTCSDAVLARGLVTALCRVTCSRGWERGMRASARLVWPARAPGGRLGGTIIERR